MTLCESDKLAVTRPAGLHLSPQQRALAITSSSSCLCLKKNSYKSQALDSDVPASCLDLSGASSIKKPHWGLIVLCGKGAETASIVSCGRGFLHAGTMCKIV